MLEKACMRTMDRLGKRNKSNSINACAQVLIQHVTEGISRLDITLHVFQRILMSTSKALHVDVTSHLWALIRLVLLHVVRTGYQDHDVSTSLINEGYSLQISISYNPHST